MRQRFPRSDDGRGVPGKRFTEQPTAFAEFVRRLRAWQQGAAVIEYRPLVWMFIRGLRTNHRDALQWLKVQTPGPCNVLIPTDTGVTFYPHPGEGGSTWCKEHTPPYIRESAPKKQVLLNVSTAHCMCALTGGRTNMAVSFVPNRVFGSTQDTSVGIF